MGDDQDQDQDDSQQPEKLCIEIQPDGTFRVYEDEGDDQDGDEGQEQGDNDDVDQTVQSPDDVLKLVAQWLQQEASEGQQQQPAAQQPQPNPRAAQQRASQAAWNEEAAKRGPDGFRR